MTPTLKDYLLMATSPEEKEKIEKAHEVFDLLGMDNNHSFDEIVHVEEEADAGGTAAEIVSLTLRLQHQILGDFSIVLDPDCVDMDLMTDLIRGLLALEDHEDRVTIERITQLEVSHREIFCELMTMTTRYSVDDLLQVVVSVSPSLFVRLKERSEESFTVDEDVAANRRAKLLAFQHYDIWLPDGAPSRLRTMIKQGVDVDMPYLVYANTCVNDFERMEPDQIAEEMFGMALISSDGSDRPAEMVKEHLEQFVANTDTLTAVMSRVGQILTGMQP